MGENGSYGHVNFIAKAKLEDSKEELFFAELRYNRDKSIMMPTCFYSLEGKEQVGGCNELEGECAEDIDLRLCYACPKSVLHPEDGILYQSGHFTSYGYYN